MLRRKLSGASRRALSTAIRPRRSALYLPGSNARALEKAKSLPCDVLLLDCEDAVAPDNKELARDQIAGALRAGGYGRRELVVRTNSLDTPWGVADLRAAAAAGADASGASYNPSKSSHRALLAEAEAIEAARRAAEDAETDWWAERDRRRLVSEDEDEAESDSESASESESDDGGENGADGARPQKSSRSLKKGRAQRNRMKRARLQAFEKRQRDEGKRQRAAFDGLKRLRRELDEREAEAVLLAAWDSSLVRKFASDHASHTATPTAGSRQGAREGAAAEGRAADGAAGRRARRRAHRRPAVEQGHARHGRRGPARRARRGASPRQTRPAQEAAEAQVSRRAAAESLSRAAHLKLLPRI